jgi:hypothetical protein
MGGGSGECGAGDVISPWADKGDKSIDKSIKVASAGRRRQIPAVAE